MADLKSGSLNDYYEFTQVTNSLKLRVPRSYFIEENIYYRNDEINKSLGGETYYSKYSDTIRHIIVLKSNNLPIKSFVRSYYLYAGGMALRRFFLYQSKLRENAFSFKYVHVNPKIIFESNGTSAQGSGVLIDNYNRVFAPHLGNVVNDLALKLNGISEIKTITSLNPNGYQLTFSPAVTGFTYNDTYWIYEKQLHDETLTVRLIDENFRYKEIDNIVEMEIRLEVMS
ncbi:MAG: hypothetical protein AMQ22_00234 [Candidatus Methanofastidiosum methylothiophilum]|uniref:Uncharacterized protein n=1 Tax=Candidatus Methanofastidiosum methylothiophilum TaxID=1705564 RepID=A0A150J8H8_9EURY|nr:MAG: hypothetical protein AMQ22_00234 [Candidatus Methanofastidiosum methylthiophilus]